MPGSIVMKHHQIIVTLKFLLKCQKHSPYHNIIGNSSRTSGKFKGLQLKKENNYCRETRLSCVGIFSGFRIQGKALWKGCIGLIKPKMNYKLSMGMQLFPLIHPA
ncbi:hypothetical protein ACU8KH_03142 [Lachancea thermotolerans]